MAQVQDLHEDGAGIGGLLRRRRVEAGSDIASLARDLCIHRRYIQAIEDNRIQDLPGKTYAIGFVRAYAGYLGLDAEAVVERFKRESFHGEQGEELVFPSPPSEGGTPKGAVLLLGAFIAIAAYGVWYLSESSGIGMRSLVDPVPERFTAWLGGEAARTSGRGEGGAGAQKSEGVAGSGDHRAVELPAGTAQTSGPGENAEESGRTAPGGQPLAGQSAAERSSMETTAMPQAGGSGSSSEQRSDDAAVSGPRVLLKATADCWIEIRDEASGKLVYARLLRGGDRYAVPDRPSLKLLVGNAGALEIVVDGQTVPPLGRHGMVVRNVALEPERLHSLTAAGSTANWRRLGPAGARGSR